MDTSIHRETAKIYRFPQGERRRPARDERRMIEAPRVPTTSGSGWYHDQAINDAREAHRPT